jgi:phosphoglycolate phosphatase
MKDRFDLLIFDWDGTLVDSIDWIVHCVQTAARRCECPVPSPQAAKDIIGLSIQEAMNTLFPEVDSSIQKQMVSHYSELFFSKQTTADDLFNGVEEMLIGLKQAGYQLAVATGKTRSGLNKVLHSTGISELFCMTRCSDETASKPHPLMLEEIMQHTGISPERTLMIGDSIHDLQMAINAQVSSVGVTCGAHSAQVLQQYQPLLCLEKTTELLEIMIG